MKISKSKQELARIISENGGWRNGEFAAQDGDGGVGGYAVKPEWNLLAKYWWRGAWGKWFLANKIKNHHQTVLYRAEYLHLYPAPGADGWIEWNGGECPVGGDVCVKFRSGAIQDAGISAHRFYWKHDGDISDIIAYRLHKPEKSKPEFCESVMRSIPEPTAKPTIEQLAADYRNAKAYAEAKLEELIAAGKALGLDVSPITSKQELVITDWRDLRVGDRIWVGDSGYDNNCPAGEYDIADRDHGDDGQPVGVMWSGRAHWPQIHERGWRFIRRP